MRREGNKLVLALAALLAAGVMACAPKPVQARSPFVCSGLNGQFTWGQNGCGTAINEGLVIQLYVLTCRHPTSDPTNGNFNSCPGYGGSLEWIKPAELEITDYVADADAGYTLQPASVFAFWGNLGGGDDGGDSGGDAEPFDPADLDPAQLAGAFGAGWSLVALALIAGTGFNVILGVLKRI